MCFKIKLFRRAALIATLLFIAACDDHESTISAKNHIDFAKTYLKQGSFKSSIIEGKNALKLEPENIDAFIILARALIQLGDGSNAASLMKKAIVLAPENQELKILLARAYITDGKMHSAEKTASEINTTTIKDKAAYYLLQADILYALDNTEAAKNTYLKALETQPASVDAMIGIARTALLTKSTSELNKYTDLAVKTEPNNTNVLLWQARVFMLQHKYSDAENALSKAMIELDHYDTLTANKYAAIEMLVKVLVAQGKVEQSFIYSNYLSQSQPGQIQASFKEALNLAAKGGDLSEAEQAFEQLLKQAPRHKASGIILGLINFEKGEYSQAEDYLSKYATDETSPLRSKKLLALTKIKLNKTTEAIEILHSLLTDNANDADLHAMIGFAYLQQGDADNSINALQQAISLSSNKSIYHTNLSLAFLLKNEPKQAVISAEKALAISPQSERARLALISAYSANNQPAQAKHQVQSWLKQQPENIQALLAASYVEQQADNAAASRRLILRALKIEPLNLATNMQMIQLDLKENKVDSSLERLDLIIRKYPDHPQALEILFKIAQNRQYTEKVITLLTNTNSRQAFAINTQLLLTQLYLLHGQPDKVIQSADNIISVNPRNIPAYQLKARAYLLLKNDDAAIKIYKLLTSVAPQSPTGHYELSQFYMLTKNYPKVIDHASDAIKIRNNYIPAYVVMITAYIKNKDYDAALKSIASLRKVSTSSELADELEADYYLAVKNYSAALVSLKKAWSSKQSISLANKILNTYINNRQYNMAFTAWDELARANPHDLKIQLTYAVALQNEKQFKKAQLVLEDLLKLFPDNPVVLNNLALLYFETKDKRSLNSALKAYKLMPANPAIQDTLGWIQVSQFKNYNDGIPLLEKAYNSSSDPQIKQHLLTALTNAGLSERARVLRAQP